MVKAKEEKTFELELTIAAADIVDPELAARVSAWKDAKELEIAPRAARDEAKNAWAPHAKKKKKKTQEEKDAAEAAKANLDKTRDVLEKVKQETDRFRADAKAYAESKSQEIKEEEKRLKADLKKAKAKEAFEEKAAQHALKLIQLQAEGRGVIF